MKKHSNRKPGQPYCLREEWKTGYVMTAPNDGIAIVLPVQGVKTILPRKDARLLAKRLHQCLDETVIGKCKRENDS